MSEKIERAIVANDFHYPFHDPRMVTLWQKFIKDLKPDTIIINGDLLDCWELSDFDKNPRDESKFKKEIEIGQKFFSDLRYEFPQAHIVYVYGNHEYRLQKYLVRHAAAISELLSLEELLKLDSVNVEISNSGLRESFYQYGQLFVSHFNKVSQHGGWTAKQLVDKYGVSIIHGHTHRVGSTIRATLDGRWLGGWDNGCLCDLKPTYVLAPNWCHAFSIVNKWPDGRFQVIQIPVIKYKFCWGDKMYQG